MIFLVLTFLFEALFDAKYRNLALCQLHCPECSLPTSPCCIFKWSVFSQVAELLCQLLALC